MYTSEEFSFSEKHHIMDPDGIIICVVQNKDEAEALLSHLNEGR